MDHFYRLTRQQRSLIGQLAWREITGRYRGAFFGLLWPLINPLLMLAIYNFVFGTVFQSRWFDGSPNTVNFTLNLFVGLIVFGFFSECLVRAPNLIIENTNYVKKVIFPLEILSVASVVAALFHACIGFCLLALVLVFDGKFQLSTLWLPLVLAPLVVLTAGVSWCLASVGVFIRDIRQAIGMMTTALLFLSPVFYPSSALPSWLQNWMALNPLTLPIEQSRAVLLLGQPPDWGGLALYGLIAVACAWAGLTWFKKTRPGFSDVL